MAADLRLAEPLDDHAAHDLLFRALEERRMPEALDGDFALAIWDANRKELTLARDRLGIRPLFLARMQHGDIAFASFPEALIDAGFVDGSFQPKAFSEQLLLQRPVCSEIWIKGLERIPPGHMLSVGADGERLRQYWCYPVVQSGQIICDHADGARALRRRLESAVRRALPARGPVCTYLSGGLDSSAVTAIAARLVEVPSTQVIGHCVGMPEHARRLGAIGEESTAQSVARRAGASLVAFPYDMVGDLLLGPLSSTFLTPTDPSHAYEQILTHAANTGTDRILCGFGGDEVVSNTGELALLADFLALRWRALRSTANELSEPLWRALARQAAVTLLPPFAERLLRMAARAPSREARFNSWQFRSAGLPAPRRRTTIHPGVRQRDRIKDSYVQYRLERQAWEAARHGLRTVFPLLDWRLIEFSARLPLRLQLRGGMGRALFRTAVTDLLPEEVLKRRTKLLPCPTMLYDLAVNRQALIDEAKRISSSLTASAVINLSEIERRLTALPGPESVAQMIRASAAEGLQMRDLRVALISPFWLARALAQNEAECAKRAASRSRAA